MGRAGIQLVRWNVMKGLKKVQTKSGLKIETFEADIRGRTKVFAYEHPWMARFCHWVNAISLFVLIGSGWRIFRAFPSFGPKIPERVLINIPDAFTLGRGLSGALQWHLTFMFPFVLTGLLYVCYELARGHYRQVLFTVKDVPGLWPMFRHYFLFGPKPESTEPYNALQKQAYTAAVMFGAASAITGATLWKPVQLWWLAWLMGGFHWVRVWHFLAMCGLVAFIPGHLLMVVLHGFNNFWSMITGWKRDPEYLADAASAEAGSEPSD